MTPDQRQFVRPTPTSPLLIGLLVDVSGSMIESIQVSDNASKSRLECFRDALDTMIDRGIQLSRQRGANAVLPLLSLFAYGFGFNPLALLFGGSSVQDLLMVPGATRSTVSIDELATEWRRYRDHINSLAYMMFGGTPMVGGLLAAEERFGMELQNHSFMQPPILFVLSDGIPDEPPDQAVAISDRLKDTGVMIISCYVTDSEITEPKRLYGVPQPKWPEGARLMFDCASDLPLNSPFARQLQEFSWKLDTPARLFTQINHGEVLTEFMNAVLSPLAVESESASTLRIASPKPREKPDTGGNDKQVFDVFLSHNSQDKELVKQLGSALRLRGLTVWLDEWVLRPGLVWQDALEDIVENCHSAAVCVGKSGFGPWEEPEMQALLRRFVAEKKRGNVVPVIPVLLPTAPGEVKLPVFLQAFTWVDARKGIDEKTMDRLVWGVTGDNPYQ